MERDMSQLENCRRACLKAARDAADQALQSGLCAEGALEAALGAIEMLDIEALMRAEEPADNELPADDR